MSSKKHTQKKETGVVKRDNEVPPRKKVRETIRYQFTIEELNAKSQELARSNKELNQVELDKKQVVSNFKAQEEALNAKINMLSNAVVNGYEIKPMDVMMEKNYDNHEKIYYDLNDGRELMRSPFTNEDYQLDLEEQTNLTNEGNALAN